jgi:hypothetical protein
MLPDRPDVLTEKYSMHDWTLLSVSIDWDQGQARFDLRSPSGPRYILASEFLNLIVPRARPWGPSVSINTHVGPTAGKDGYLRLAIEMQSGDRIEIVARQIEITDKTQNPA